MARPGLHTELQRLKLLPQATIIAMGQGSDAQKAGAMQQLLAKADSEFQVTSRALFILRRHLEGRPDVKRPKVTAKVVAAKEPPSLTGQAPDSTTGQIDEARAELHGLLGQIEKAEGLLQMISKELADLKTTAASVEKRLGVIGEHAHRGR